MRYKSNWSPWFGAGAALFAKRKQKSEKWIVDENTVKQKVANQAAAAAATMPAVVPAEPVATPTISQTRAEQSQKMAAVQVTLKIALSIFVRPIVIDFENW